MKMNMQHYEEMNLLLSLTQKVKSNADEDAAIKRKELLESNRTKARAMLEEISTVYQVTKIINESP